jgi:hypothetical protein
MNKRSRTFQLWQILACVTALAAMCGLFVVLIRPPEGTSGLRPAAVTGVVLVVAIWFCRTTTEGRLKTMLAVNFGLALTFFAMYESKTDFMFGHYQGPPPWLFAFLTCAILGMGTGLAHLLRRVVVRRAGIIQEVKRNRSLLRRCVAAVGWLILFLILGVMIGDGVSDFPRAIRNMPRHIEKHHGKP